MEYSEHTAAVYIFPIVQFFYWGSQLLFGILLVLLLVNLKIKRFNNRIIIRALFILPILYFFLAQNFLSIPNPDSLMSEYYHDGTSSVIRNNLKQAIHNFEQSQSYQELSYKMRHILVWTSDISESEFYTGSFEDNINALEPTLNTSIINEIAVSNDKATSISYLFKGDYLEYVLLDTFPDGSVFVSTRGSWRGNFDWLIEEGVTISNYDTTTSKEISYFQYQSNDAFNDLLEAIINMESDALAQTDPLDCGPSMEYLNVTMDGVSYPTYQSMDYGEDEDDGCPGYHLVNRGENSAFGENVQEEIINILILTIENGDRITAEEFRDLSESKHEAVGNTSLTNYRWTYYFYQHINGMTFLH